MIKINLLPQQKRAKVTHAEKDIAVLILVLIVIGASIFGVDFYFSSQISELQAAVESKTAIKKQLEEKVKNVNTILEDLDKLKSRVKIIKDVRLRQGLPVRYIDELIVNIPKNKMWVEGFTLNANGQITLSGVALDNQSFAHYVEKLRESKYIARVDTQRTSRKTIDGLGLISFQCSVTAKEYFENQDTNGTTNG
jgi:type IV pilus assembly protein PilN